jgi:hypothetical protein
MATKFKTCEFCGWNCSGRAKYCSAKCKQAAYRRRADSEVGGGWRWRNQSAQSVQTKSEQFILFECAICHKETGRTGLQTNMLYCSDACKQKAYRLRKAAEHSPIEE